MNKLCMLFALLAMLAAVAAAPVYAESAEEASAGLIKVGSDAIPFALVDLAGDTVDYDKDLRGEKAVLLVFWSLFCGPCQEELPLLDTLTKKYADKPLKIYAVNLDGPRRGRAVRKYMKKKDFQFEVLWEIIDGVAYQTADAYGILGTPTSILIDKQGKIALAHVGKETEENLVKVIEKAIAN